MIEIQVEDSYIDSYSFRLKIYQHEEWINSMENFIKILMKTLEEKIKLNKGIKIFILFRIK